MEWLIILAILLVGSAGVATVRTWWVKRKVVYAEDLRMDDVEDAAVRLAYAWVRGRELTFFLIDNWDSGNKARIREATDLHRRRRMDYVGEPRRSWPQIIRMYWDLNRFDDSKRELVILGLANGHAFDRSFTMMERERFENIRRDMDERGEPIRFRGTS